MLKIAKGIEITDISSPIIGKLQHAHCSSVVGFEDGEVLVVYFHAIKEAHRLQAIYGRRKRAKDSKWSKPFLVSKDVKLARMEGNPVLWIAPDTGKLWMFYITSWGGWSTCILRYKTSEDRGRTWSKSRKVYGHISRLSKNPPVMLDNGDYVLPVTIEFRECTPMFFVSSDQGKSWTDPGARITLPEKFWPENKAKTSKFPERELDQPTIIQRDDGNLLCLMRAYRPLGKMYQTISEDGGRTWSEPEPSTLPNPDGGFNMIKLRSGNVAIAYNHSSEVRNPLSVALSEDDGKSWKYRKNICEYHKNATTGEASMADNEKSRPETFQYPTIHQSKDGRLHCTWSNGRSLRVNGQVESVTDIQYTSFTEDWIKEKPFEVETWLL